MASASTNIVVGAASGVAGEEVARASPGSSLKRLSCSTCSMGGTGVSSAAGGV